MLNVSRRKLFQAFCVLPFVRFLVPKKPPQPTYAQLEKAYNEALAKGPEPDRIPLYYLKAQPYPAHTGIRHRINEDGVYELYIDHTNL